MRNHLNEAAEKAISKIELDKSIKGPMMPGFLRSTENLSPFCIIYGYIALLQDFSALKEEEKENWDEVADTFNAWEINVSRALEVLPDYFCITDDKKYKDYFNLAKYNIDEKYNDTDIINTLLLFASDNGNMPDELILSPVNFLNRRRWISLVYNVEFQRPEGDKIGQEKAAAMSNDFFDNSNFDGTAEDKHNYFKNISDKYQRLRSSLSEKVLGQDGCIAEFVGALFAAELDEGEKRDRPKAVFLFAGPPGVGKTLLAESAARELGIPYKRFDMSGYASENDFFQFTGSDSSYRNGHKGMLSECLEVNPEYLFIFDEIEKAGPKVHNIFLQILGSGEFVDDYLKKTFDCRRAIMIFTTNAGEELYESRHSGLSDIPKSVLIETIRNQKRHDGTPLISSALLSRFASEKVLLFNHLGINTLRRVVKKSFSTTASLLNKKIGCEICYDDRMPLLFLYHNNKLDARIASSRGEDFFKAEVYELSRQLGNQGNILDQAESIEFKIDVPEEASIKELFEIKKKQRFLIVGDVSLKSSYGASEKHYTVKYADADLEKMPDSTEVSAVFIDPFYEIDNEDRRPIGLEDAVSPGIRLFQKMMRNNMSVPVYLIDSSGKISKTDRETFMQLGAEGIIEKHKVKKENTDALNELAELFYMTRQSRDLRRKGYILDYDTAIEKTADGKGVVISYYNLRKTQAMDEVTGNIALSDMERPKERFEDVIGAESAKEELKYYKEYLKNPVTFIKKGGAAPKGLLLYGEPGTGKTMLARALAGETECSFFQASAAEFFNKFVGEGERAIRELFLRARKYAPSIIFIDEIDAIGKRRTGNDNNTQRENILNILLTEMDGFEGHRDRPVFVLAATNYGISEDDLLQLDPALLRRFNNRVMINLPKKAERFQYLEYMAKKKGYDALTEGALKSLAERTTGQTIAVLEQILDMMLRMSIRNNKPLSDKLLMEAMDEYMYGEEHERKPEYYRRTAFHEAGHAYVAMLGGLKPAFMTIVSRGNFGGYMQYEHDEEKGEQSAQELLARIRVSLAGRIAEGEFYDKEIALNTGASMDLKKASEIALDYICRYGMKEGELVAVNPKEIYTSPLAAKYIEEVNELLKQQEKECRELVQKGRRKISALAEELIEQSYLDSAQIQKIFKTRRV